MNWSNNNNNNVLSVVQYFIGNLIIAFDLNITPTSRNYIVYVNGESRVVSIYPVKI